MTGPRLITVREAAEVLRCHPKTVERAVRAGRITATLFAPEQAGHLMHETCGGEA